MKQDEWFERLAESANEADELTPSCLRSQIYSRLIVAQEETGPLASLRASKEAGRGLCVFERLVEIMPQQADVQAFQYCKVCHARVAGERVENAPIYWAHCPYCEFQNR